MLSLIITMDMPKWLETSAKWTGLAIMLLVRRIQLLNVFCGRVIYASCESTASLP